MATEIWSDLSHELITDARGSLKKVININAVKTSIDNIIGTFTGERVMLPEFGSPARDMLFDPISEDEFDSIATDLKKNIEAWDDRVMVVSMKYNANPDDNYVGIYIEFSIKGYSDIFSHTSTIESGG